MEPVYDTLESNHCKFVCLEETNGKLVAEFSRLNIISITEDAVDDFDIPVTELKQRADDLAERLVKPDETLRAIGAVHNVYSLKEEGVLDRHPDNPLNV